MIEGGIFGEPREGFIYKRGKEQQKKYYQL